MTIRSIDEATRIGLRRVAAAGGQSVESMVRETLSGIAVKPAEETMVPSTKPTGMAEQAIAWPASAAAAKPSFDLLWGALAGRIHPTDSTTLADPTGETWEAKSGPV